MTEHDNIYRLSVRTNTIYILQGISAVSVLGLIFYRSLFGILLLSPIIYFYRKSKIKNFINDQKWKLNLEFKDAILALSAALEAGYSAENAFDEACKDLKQLYQENALILKEFNYIINQIKVNITIEKALNNFSERSGIEDILNFSEVFQTAKRSGGDLIQVIRITSKIICDKIEVKREIITLITSKRLEANIMKVLPLFILVYLSISSPGFLDPLYHNFLGICVMTILLLSYLCAILMIDKIVAIEV